MRFPIFLLHVILVVEQVFIQIDASCNKKKHHYNNNKCDDEEPKTTTAAAPTKCAGYAVPDYAATTVFDLPRIYVSHYLFINVKFFYFDRNC